MLAELGRDLGIAWTDRPSLVRLAMGAAAVEGALARQAAAIEFLDSDRQVRGMIILFHPRSTKPKNRRLPLSVLYLGAVLEGPRRVRNRGRQCRSRPVARRSTRWRESGRVEMLGVSVMPGPQLLQAVAVCRAFREKYPRIPIVWGGYFASLYTEAALNAKYVDFVVKGQGEDTLLELIDELRGARDFSRMRGLVVQRPVRPARAHRRAAR